MMIERPNPDELLDKLQRSEEKQRRGQLKIFFGACAGVGKTYAMLSAAQVLRAQKQDVIVGVVETHGRPETAALLTGLAVLPLKSIQYRNKVYSEFDLDAALNCKSSLVLVDELAHTNVKGSRHTKRWQDVEELLDAGIDVYATVNVQHLDSLNDVVGHITGIKVFETIPDRIFDTAAEVILVDLPPDELLQRLEQGKVYMPVQTQHAIQNFFRKGNLIALRELALRRMADRVDVQMREYRTEQAISQVWQTKERVLVCLGLQESGGRLVRKAYRLATSLRADWIAVYVETPRLQKLSKSKRDQIFKNLKLAQELGAETIVLSGTDIPKTLVRYARSRNVLKIIVGKPQRSKLARLWRPTLAESLINEMADIDIYVVRSDIEPEEQHDETLVAKVTSLEFETAATPRWRGYLWSLIILSGLTALSGVIVNYSNVTNVAMLYVLGAAITAVCYGRGPSLLTSFLGVAIFDFLFVPPQLSFSVSDSAYLITFAVMLIVTLIISNLTSGLRYQARVASYRERRTSAVYALSKELSAALTLPQISEISVRHLSSVFQAKVFLLLPDSKSQLYLPLPEVAVNLVCDLSIAQWVYDHRQVAGLGTQTLPSAPMLYFPLQAPMGVRGVLAISPTDPKEIFLPEQQRLLDTFARQIALALEHIHYVEVARDALLSMESERLRNSLLNDISHNLQAPLTDILDWSDTLVRDEQLSDRARQEFSQAIYDKTLYMSNLITHVWKV